MKESWINKRRIFIGVLAIAVTLGLLVLGCYQDRASEIKNEQLRQSRKIVPIVSASSSGSAAESWSVAKAIDGNTSTGWATPARSKPQEEYLLLDIGKIVDIATVSWLPANGNPQLGPAQFTIEISRDGVKWLSVFSKQDYKPRENVWFTTSFDPAPARYVKLKTITPNFKDSPWPEKYMLQIMEFEVRSPNDDENVK